MAVSAIGCGDHEPTEPARVRFANLGEQPSGLVLQTNSCSGTADVPESDTEIHVLVPDDDGDCDGLVVVELNDPLGDRELIDDTSGVRVTVREDRVDGDGVPI